MTDSTSAPILGIQMSPISLLREGSDDVMGWLREEAGMNALFTYSSTYQIPHWERHLKGQLATDHGGPAADFDYAQTRQTWFDPDPRYYAGRRFRRSDDTGKLLLDRDVFSESFEAAERHGFRIFGRALEAEFGAHVIPGWAQLCTVDCYGAATHRPCPNHPEYRAFWASALEDLFKSYPNLAGFKFGAERPGPLFLAMFNGPGFWYWKLRPDCFCGHCCERMQSRKIDPERAREGSRRLYEYTRGLREGTADRRDGALTGCLRILIQYPETLAHHREFLMSLEDLHAWLSGIVHAVRAEALFGLHVYQPVTAFDFVHRATLDYRRMGEYVDFLKPVLYRHAAGPRMAEYLASVEDSVFSDFDPELLPTLLYSIHGFEGPPRHELREKGFDRSYVFNETKRCVDGLAGRALTLAGPGFDIGGPSRFDSPESVYESIAACFEAGADGLIVSREYDEMQRPHLQAVGRAIRDCCG